MFQTVINAIKCQKTTQLCLITQLVQDVQNDNQYKKHRQILIFSTKIVHT